MPDVVWEAVEYLEQGGWVMVPLGMVSLALWALVADVAMRYAGWGRDDIDGPGAARALAGGATQVEGDGLRRTLLNSFLADRSGDPELDRDILHQHVLSVRPRIRQLLGLLGTVLGMIETFEVIALFGTGNAKAMASGISVALVTTQAGLLVAVPGLLVSGALVRRARRLEAGFDEFTHILDRTLRHGSATA